MDEENNTPAHVHSSEIASLQWKHRLQTAIAETQTEQLTEALALSAEDVDVLGAQCAVLTAELAAKNAALEAAVGELEQSKALLSSCRAPMGPPGPSANGSVVLSRMRRSSSGWSWRPHWCAG